MRKHEQSLADRFNNYLARKASLKGIAVEAFSLDGQDSLVGADYVLADSHRFALVEFKYTQHDLVSEAHKPRRLTLCYGLQMYADMRQLHDQCHFVAWSDYPSMECKVNIYRLEVCNRRVFGSECDLPDEFGDVSKRIDADQFSNDFLGPLGIRSLSLEDFETYLTWVLESTSSATTSTFELIAFDPDAQNLVLAPLTSLRAAQDWIQRNRPSLNPSPWMRP